MITALKPNEVIVVGSNRQGQHGAGAAAQAYREFGLVWGVGEGLSGQTYALPTMEGKESFQNAIHTFIHFAWSHPQYQFLLTKVGCGIAGYTEREVNQMFQQATRTGWPKNVIKEGWDEQDS